MKYFLKPAPIAAPRMTATGLLTYDEYLNIPGGDPRQEQHSVWSHPIWRASAENAEHWEAARESLAKAGKYVAMPDDAFAIFKPLAIREGQSLNPDLMPLIKPVLRATSTKPADFDEAQAAPAETVSAN